MKYAIAVLPSKGKNNIDEAMVFHNYDDAFKALNRLPDNMWAYYNVDAFNIKPFKLEEI